jgi:hypothetical protein
MPEHRSDSEGRVGPIYFPRFTESRQLVIACQKRMAVIDSKGWTVLLIFPEMGTSPLCALSAKEGA